MLRDYHKTYGIKRLLKSIIKVDDWKSLRPVDILFVIHDFNRTYSYKDKSYSPLLDSLQEVYLRKGYSCLTIASPFSQIVKGDAFGTVIDFNGSFIRAAILRIFRNLLGKERVFGTRFIQGVWQKILSLTRPKRVITIHPSVSLCGACREMGIDLSDLQHGVINDGHHAYGEEYKRESQIQGLPTSFLCWDETAVSTLEKWTKSKGIRLELIPNPWIQRFIDNDPADDLVGAARADNAWLLKLPKMKRILITLGWGFGHVDDELLTKMFDMPVTMPQCLSFPTPVIDIVRQTHEAVTWFIRPHPAQLKGAERAPLQTFLQRHFGGLANVYWDEITSTPLPLLLEATDLHLTFSSTVTSEAAVFGVRTGLIAPIPRPDAYLDTYFVRERKDAMAEFVPDTTEDIRSFITRELARG